MNQMARYKTERESIEICIEFLRVQKKKKKKNTLISIHAFFPSIKYLISIEDHFPNSSQGEEKILGSNSRDFIIIIIPKMHTDRIGRNSNFLYTHTQMFFKKFLLIQFHCLLVICPDYCCSRSAAGLWKYKHLIT